MINFTQLNIFKNILSKDDNGREINIYKIKDVYPLDLYYPNVSFGGEVNIFPLKEKIMSLQKLDVTQALTSILINNIHDNINIDTPIFFFVYNTDNYYHFVYDTLPYLISYFELKKDIPELKLLMSYPNKSKNEFYRFVNEYLELLGIAKDDIIIINERHLYKEIYISNSYTHDIDSNLPPRKEIYDLYNKLIEKAKELYDGNIELLPDRIYISRRTWINGDISNIGTNYTTKRKLEIEDELVKFLKEENFSEIFAENLTTIEKIILFNNAKYIIGAIGGGLCNVLFSKVDCTLIGLISPTFLDINRRFLYSFENVNFVPYYGVHTESGIWKKWMRVTNNEVTGEIEKVNKDTLVIIYTDDVIAGWNSELKYKKIELNKSDCKALDDGLNSSWTFDLPEFIETIKHI